MQSAARTQIRENLERLRSCAGLDHGRAGLRTWMSVLELTSRELKQIDELKADVSARTLERAAGHFGLSTDALQTGEIDFRGISIRHCKSSELPEPYQVAAFGRRRGTISALDYVEQKSGWRARREVFRRFRVNEAMFSNPMDPISMRFMTEVSDHLISAQGYRKPDLRAMGIQTYAANRGTIVESVLSRCRCPAELYERLFGDMVKFFELNCRYTIVELSRERCVVDVSSRSDVAEALRVRHLGNEGICELKAGMMASVTAYLGLGYARVQERSCVHRGDPVCRYEIRYQAPRPAATPLS